MVSSLQRPASPFTIQLARSIRSSIVNLYPCGSSSKTLNRSFRQSALVLWWNTLPAELRRPKDSGSPGTSLLPKSTFFSKQLDASKHHLFLADPNLHYAIRPMKIQAILLGKVPTQTILHRLSNALTNNLLFLLPENFS